MSKRARPTQAVTAPFSLTMWDVHDIFKLIMSCCVLLVGDKAVASLNKQKVKFTDGSEIASTACVGRFRVRQTDTEKYATLRQEYCPIADKYQHAAASNRSEFFASKLTYITGAIVTLDARLRNCWHATEAGVRPSRIHVVEHNIEVAIYQSLLMLVLYDGTYPHIIHGGIVEYLGRISVQVGALYLDLCGKIPISMPAVLDRLVNLQIYGVTMSKREPKCKKYIAEFFGPAKFVMVQEFLHKTVDCQFYMHPGLPAAALDCSDFEHLIDHVVGTELVDGVLMATVAWHWYPKNGKIEEYSNVLAADIPELVAKYDQARAAHTTAWDPVKTKRQKC